MLQIEYLTQNSGQCVICGVSCSTSCGSCKKVGYCSKAHQQKHWKLHKSTCFPLILQTNEILGRYLVTTRDVKQGEIILKEFPIFSGPHLAEDFKTGSGDYLPVCLSCFRIPQKNFACPRCHWPLCGIDCQNNEQHASLECKIFSEKGITPDKYYSSNPICDVYEGVTVLRGVLQKQLNPEKWQKISQLQSHKEERDELVRARKLRDSCIRFIRQICAQIQCQEEDIDQVLGAIETNAFVSDDGVSTASLYRNGTYLYHIASMPAHNCVPNSSWIVQLNSEFQLRAAVPIKCGESVNFLYTEATLGSYDRRKKLLDSKYFLCACPRCRDPTELGTYFSAVKCPQANCPDGYLLPMKENEWNCEKCPCEKSFDFVRSILSSIDQQLLNVDAGDNFHSVEKLLEILAQHSGKTLHKNHFKAHDIENDILQRISFLLLQMTSKTKHKSGNGMETRKWAQILVNLSKKCLEIANKIWPGYNRHRGRLLYFLQQGLLILILEDAFPKGKFVKNKNSASLRQDLQKLLEIRQEVLNIFCIEPEGREESFIAASMQNEPKMLTDLKEFLI